MAGKQSVNIDPLLEPLLAPTRDEEIDQYLSQLIDTHVGPVIKGVVRHKLHLNSHRGIEQADAAIHSPNEHLVIDQYHRGIEALIRFICDFAEQSPQQ